MADAVLDSPFIFALSMQPVDIDVVTSLGLGSMVFTLVMPETSGAGDGPTSSDDSWLYS